MGVVAAELSTRSESGTPTLLSFQDPRWLEFIRSRPEATIFYHPAWISTVAECYGYGGGIVAVSRANGQLRAGLPLVEIDSLLTSRRGVGLAFSDLCPPLTVDAASLEELVYALQEWRKARRWPTLEVKGPLPEQDGMFPGETVAVQSTPLSRDAEQVFRRFKRTRVQQQIRQAESEGLIVISQGASWEDTVRFYQLHLLTRRRLGVPVQPKRFFRILWERLIAQGLGFVLLASKDGHPVAGAVMLHFNSTLTIKFSASDEGYWKLRPNHLLLWHAIRWGCENGYQVFDWGKTEPANHGLRDFKGGWGSEEQLIRYSILADQPPAPSRLDKTQHYLALLIQHSPPWVCRAIGETLYGHFA